MGRAPSDALQEALAKYRAATQQVTAAMGMVQSVVDAQPPGGAPPGTGVPGAGVPGDSQEVVQAVPREAAGKLIGKGGSNIRTLRDRSGARISLSDQDPAADTRQITFSGTKEQVETAQRLVNELLASPDDRPPRGAPPQHYSGPPPGYGGYPQQGYGYPPQAYGYPPSGYPGGYPGGPPQ